MERQAQQYRIWDVDPPLNDKRIKVVGPQLRQPVEITEFEAHRSHTLLARRRGDRIRHPTSVVGTLRRCWGVADLGLPRTRDARAGVDLRALPLAVSVRRLPRTRAARAGVDPD